MTLFSNKKAAFAVSALALGLVGMTTQAYAAQIQSINAKKTAANTIQLRLSFAGAPVLPVAYQQAGSKQLILDFNQTTATLPEMAKVGMGSVNSISTLSNGSITRLTIDLQNPTTYGSRIDGNELVLDIVDIPQPAPPVSKLPPNKTSDSQVDVVKVAVNPLLNPANAQNKMVGYEGISAINYNANVDGGGDISIALTSEVVPVDVQRQGNKIVVRTTGSAIPRHLLRRLNAGGLVATIDANNQGSNGVLNIQMSADYEYQAYQTGSQLIISVRPAKPLTEPTLEEKVYTGEPLSMEFQDIPVRTVLDVLAGFTGQNIVANDSVTGNITLRLINVPWDQALDIILKSRDLSKRTNGNVILVAPTADLTKQESDELRALSEVKDLAPLRTEFIRLNYAKADKVVALLNASASTGSGVRGSNDRTGQSSGTLLSPRGSVSVDERTNMLMVKDTSESINNIRLLVEKIDIPVAQVMIEARIVTANDNFSKDMGVKWGLLGNKWKASGTDVLAVGGSNTTLWDLRKPGPLELKQPDNLNIDLGAKATAGRIAFGILGIPNTLLDLELSAMQADKRGEVISSPKVLTTDKQKARISSGQQIPYQEASASGATAVVYKEAALVLEVTPNVTPDGKIGLELSVKNGSPKDGGAVIQEDSIETNVVLEDGQTVVLGGVFKKTRSNQVDKVPFLGDLPYVGKLFQRNSRQNNKEELLIFITPKLVNDGVSHIN